MSKMTYSSIKSCSYGVESIRVAMGELSDGKKLNEKQKVATS